MERKIHVAVAEDEDFLRRDICRAIEADPHMQLCASAGTGRDICRLALERDVDVILMDIEMERSDAGIQAAARIAQQKPGIIIVFLSVHEEDDLVYQAFSAAVNVDYVVKSASYDVILRKIEDAYFSRNQIDPQIMRKLTGEFMRMRRQRSESIRFYNILFTVTPSERELIRLLLHDMKVPQIARLRCVEPATVKSQINSLLKKFQVRRSREIVSQIRRLGMEPLFEGPAPTAPNGLGAR